MDVRRLVFSLLSLLFVRSVFLLLSIVTNSNISILDWLYCLAYLDTRRLVFFSLFLLFVSLAPLLFSIVQFPKRLE